MEQFLRHPHPNDGAKALHIAIRPIHLYESGYIARQPDKIGHRNDGVDDERGHQANRNVGAADVDNNRNNAYFIRISNISKIFCSRPDDRRN